MMRKMWAVRGWDVLRFPVIADESSSGTPTPIAVMSAEGMPDFGPGDRVRKIIGQACTYAVVQFMGQDEHGRWWFYGHLCGHALASAWEKVPTEKTVTLRYAGPPDVIDKFLAGARPVPDGVRVERVEDDE